nr:hypothetical protein [Tanacetum cinerariifolium]
MDYFIFVHPRSNVRLSALFPDTEEKSSVPPHNFPSMILQKVIWNSRICYWVVANRSNLVSHKFVTQSMTTALSIENESLIEEESNFEIYDTNQASQNREQSSEKILISNQASQNKEQSKVPRKGKAKVTEEQVSHDLLSLQKHKKTSPVDQYIFQRRVSEPTGSSGYDESPYALLGQSDSEEESEKVMLGAEEGGQDEDAGTQAEGQAGSNPDEGQAGSNPDKTSEGQAGPDPGDAEVKADKNVETEVESMVNVPIQQALSSISLQTSPIIDLSSRPESPKAHQQFKATTTDTTTTTTTLPPPQDPQQSTTEAMMVKRISELEHFMADLIQVNKEIKERLDSNGSRLYTLKQLDIPQQVSIAVSEVVTDVVDWVMQAPLRSHFRDLPEADMKEILHQRMWESESYKSHEDHMQLFEALKKLMNHDHSEELAQDLAEARKKKKKNRELPKMPPGSPSHQPPPPPLPAAGPSGASGAPGASGSAQVPPSPPLPSSTNQESPSKGSATPSPSKTAASAEYQAWTTTDIRLRPSISLAPADLEMDADMAPDEQAQSSNDEDIGSAHIPIVNLRQGWWKPFEEERLATPKLAWSIRSSDVPVLTNNWASALVSNYSPPHEDSLLAQTDDIATFMNWFCKRRGITELKPQDMEGLAYKIIKVFHPNTKWKNAISS